MKTHFKYIAIIGLAFALASCGGNTEEQQATPVVEKTEIVGIAPSQMLERSIKLNNGEPWEANRETVMGIEKMRDIIHEYELREYSPELYKDLGINLMQQFEFIFKECTMEGEAHNQLHNYLTIMKGYFEELISPDKATAENGLQKFKQHVALFPKYFTG